jgi:predicted PurR-regulated permease PerM
MDAKRVTIDISPRTIIWIVLTVLSLYFIYVLRDILVILFLSYIFAAAAEPLINKLERRKIARPVSIIGLYLVIVGILVLLSRLIIPPVVDEVTFLVQNADTYAERLNEYFVGISPDFAETTKSAMTNIVTRLGSGGAVSQVLGIFSGLVGLIVVFVISFYLLWQRNGVEKAIANYLPRKYQAKSMTISRKISGKMSSWVKGQLSLVFIIFILNYIGLSILGVDYALTLAILSGVLEVLPIIGPWIAGGAAALVAFTSSPLLALFVIIWYVVVQQLENHILVPQIMKKSLGLNPITVIVAVLIGGKLLGILGVLISVPVAVSVSIIFNELWKEREQKWR